jgi:hypothetical protein
MVRLLTFHQAHSSPFSAWFLPALRRGIAPFHQSTARVLYAFISLTYLTNIFQTHNQNSHDGSVREYHVVLFDDGIMPTGDPVKLYDQPLKF